jgi:hypothetical protein
MAQPRPRLTGMAKVGLGLALGSIVPWLILPIVPFLPLLAAQKAIGASGLLVLAEVMFWVGALLAGPAMVKQYRQALHPRALWQRCRRLWKR